MSDLDALLEFLRIPSVSMQSEHDPDMTTARAWLVNFFKKLGFTTKILPGIHHPAVFSQLVTNPLATTVLVYGHYDVQPPDPLDKWTTPPFSPAIRAGKIYARGATDDKGQLMVHLAAARKLVEKFNGHPPVNLKFIIEGEEEIGSPSISKMLKTNRQLLKADYLIVSDTEMPSYGQPAIHVRLRGLLYTEIKLATADHDLHSGQFGGVAPNPAIWLSYLVTKLKAEGNHILIPGFYDAVVTPTPTELADFAKLEPSEKTLTIEGSQYWVGGGEREYSLNQRRWTRPTLDVNGLWSGYTGSGSKTIIPGSASAKISMRLVPNQNPDDVFQKFSTYVKKLKPPKARLKIIRHADCLPYIAPTSHPVFTLAKSSLKSAFGKKPVFYATGGSIGAIPLLTSALGNIPCLMIAMGNTDDDLHAPNEHFSLDNLSRGTAAMLDFYSKLATISPK